MTKKEIIERYIMAYNSFDVDAMLKDLHEEVKFRNVSNGKVNLEIKGIGAFKEQAIQAANLFRERKQQITDLSVKGNVVEVSIAYEGILAADFSDNLKAGDRIQLHGRSIFSFQDGQIISIEDIS